MGRISKRHKLASTSRGKSILVKIVAINVKKKRQALGLDQSALAKAANLSQAGLSNLERAKRGCSLEALERIAVALNCQPAELLLTPFELAK